MLIENQPHVEPVLEKRPHTIVENEHSDFRLLNNVNFVWENKRITIKSGYVWDGASIPALLRVFLSPFDVRVVAPSLLHDCLYSHPDLNSVGTYYEDDKIVRKKFTKGEADNLFRQANKANGMNPLLTNLAFLAVRIFGKGSF